MARPRLTVQSVGFHLHLPGDVYARMALLLHSEAERKMPTSARQKFISQLIKDYFKPKDGIISKEDSAQLEEAFHLISTIRDMANHPQVNPAEAIPLIAKWAQDAVRLLRKETQS